LRFEDKRKDNNKGLDLQMLQRINLEIEKIVAKLHYRNCEITLMFLKSSTTVTMQKGG
jgi:hypothetical protein